MNKLVIWSSSAINHTRSNQLAFYLPHQTSHVLNFNRTTCPGPIHLSHAHVATPTVNTTRSYHAGIFHVGLDRHQPETTFLILDTNRQKNNLSRIQYDMFALMGRCHYLLLVSKLPRTIRHVHPLSIDYYPIKRGLFPLPCLFTSGMSHDYPSKKHHIWTLTPWWCSSLDK